MSERIVIRGAEHLESGQKVRLDSENATAAKPITNPG